MRQTKKNNRFRKKIGKKPKRLMIRSRRRRGGASRQQHINDIFSTSNHIISKNAEKAKKQLNKANTQFNKAFTNVLVATRTAAQTTGEKAAQGEVIDELRKTGANIQSAITNVLTGKIPQNPDLVKKKTMGKKKRGGTRKRRRGGESSLGAAVGDAAGDMDNEAGQAKRAAEGTAKKAKRMGKYALDAFSSWVGVDTPYR